MPHPSSITRHATLADLESLVALEHATFATDRISRRQWRHHIGSANASVLVAGGTGAVEAAAVVLYRRNARNARLYSLAVATRARGTGLGKTLLAATETDARAHGCRSMHLEVRTGNVAAITMYARAGYARTAHVTGFYEDGEDAWRYVKSLAPVNAGTRTSERVTGPRRGG